MRKRNWMIHLSTILLIAIIVVSILMFFKYVKNQYEEEEKETIKTNMLLIEGKAKIILEESHAIKTELKGIKLSENILNDNIKQILEKEDIDDCYFFDRDVLNEIGLNNIELKDSIYIVNYENLDVIYIKDVGKQNYNIYKLSDLLK